MLHASIFKADEERCLVYGVISKSKLEDAQDMARDFEIRFRSLTSEADGDSGQGLR